MPHQSGCLQPFVAHLDKEAAKFQSIAPPEIHTISRGELMIGTNNRYFPVIDFANSMLRDWSLTWYEILLMFEDQDFTVGCAITIAKRFNAQYSGYLRYSGFKEPSGFSEELLKLLSEATDREEAIRAVRAFLGYLNRFVAWSFHYFPWDIGKHFTYTSPEDPIPALADLSRRVHISDGHRVRLTWQPLCISVLAILAVKENPELCNNVLERLPFTVVQDHAVVSGKSMYAWVPIISTSPVHVKERQCDAPIGRIRYSQRTGNKIVVQYGEVTEDIETPVLGEILPKYHDQLVEVGRAVLKSTLETKESIWLTIEQV